MSEISRAQRQLVDDNPTYDNVPFPSTGGHPDLVPSGSPLAKRTKRSQTMSRLEDREVAGEEGSGRRTKRSRTSMDKSGEISQAAVPPQDLIKGPEGIHGHSEHAEVTKGSRYDESTHDAHGNTSATSHDWTAENTSYNYFESSVKEYTETSTIPIPSSARDPNREQSNAPRQTPGRSKSMQILLDSPHDTAPSSSLISPRLKRAKSDLPARDILQQSPKNACDELSLPVAVEVPTEKKKRGRPKKQVVPEETAGDEPDELNADESASLQTQPTKRGRGRPRKSEQNKCNGEGPGSPGPNTGSDIIAAVPQTNQTTMVPNRGPMDHAAAEIPSCPFCPFSDPDGSFVAQHIEYCHPENGHSAESNDTNVEKERKNSVPQERERSEFDPSPDDDELDIGLPKERYIPRPSRSRARPLEESIPSESIEKPQKESKKKKLKRGKTTSVILKKSYESDVEDDVIWVDEKPYNVVFKDEGYSPTAAKPEVPNIKETGSEKNIQTDETKPSTTAAAEQKRNATSTDSAAPSQVEEPPGPKKRGRKRKKTAEPVDTEQPAEGDAQQPQNKEETSQQKGDSTVLQDLSTNAVNQTKTNDNETINNQDSKANAANENEDGHPGSPKKPDTDTALETPGKQKEVSENALSTPKDTTTTAKGPDKHSPISTTSKVPFRVGLSRKAKIAPLLKVIRK